MFKLWENRRRNVSGAFCGTEMSWTHKFTGTVTTHVKSTKWLNVYQALL